MDDCVAAEYRSRAFGRRPRQLARRLALSQGAVLQPSSWVAWRGVTATLWLSGTIDSRDPTGFHEVDPSPAYELAFGGWSLKPALDPYTYPGGTDHNSVEIEFVATHPLGGGLNSLARQSADLGAHAGASGGALGLTHESDDAARSGWAGALFMTWNSARFADACLGDGTPHPSGLQATAALKRRAGPPDARAHFEANRTLVKRPGVAPGLPVPIAAGAAIGAWW